MRRPTVQTGIYQCCRWTFLSRCSSSMFREANREPGRNFDTGARVAASSTTVHLMAAYCYASTTTADRQSDVSNLTDSNTITVRRKTPPAGESDPTRHRDSPTGSPVMHLCRSARTSPTPPCFQCVLTSSIPSAPFIRSSAQLGTA